MKAGFCATPLLHHGGQMTRWVEIGEGAVICAGCILTTYIRFASHVHINLDCTIGHDTEITVDGGRGLIVDEYQTQRFHGAAFYRFNGIVDLSKD